MGGGNGAEYAEFLHVNRKFYDFEEIRKEIEAETFRVAGQNKASEHSMGRVLMAGGIQVAYQSKDLRTGSVEFDPGRFTGIDKGASGGSTDGY